MIQRRIIRFFPLYILPFILAQSTVLAYESVSLEILSLSCQTEVLNVFSEIRQYQTAPEEIKNTSVEMAKDYKGNLSINFSVMSGIYGAPYLDSRESMLIHSKRLASSCPEIELISFSGSTWSNWTIRRDGFRKIHHKYDDNYPGDVDFYWNWTKLPFDYDPMINYFPD